MSVQWKKIEKATYPDIGFTTRFRYGKRDLVLDQMGPCREEIVYHTREELQNYGYDRHYGGIGWRDRGSITKKSEAAFDLTDPKLKQPGLTFLYAGSGEDDYDRPQSVCMRGCCTEPLLHLLDALVGPVCVLLDDDRYVGDWWQTSLDEFLGKNKKRRHWDCSMLSHKWYGTSNFFLRHPSLVSIVLGIFRQAFMVFQAGAEKPLLEKIDRKEVEDCLTNADPGQALSLINQARPWLECSSASRRFPFSSKNSRLLIDLHKAIFKHGYDEVFGGSFEDSWDLDALRTGAMQGSFTYFGTKGKQTADRKRVAKLAKK